MVLWSIFGLAFAVAITRFYYGLGVTTNLTDSVPWGFWIGFDVMGGVALAAGGFVVTAFVYIFGKKEYHSIARPAVLTAFLGYIAVVLGLLFDLGLPWNIWHMIVFWNPHSPLFEVGWCVMLYLTVLLLEFAPVPLENQPRWSKLYNTLSKFRIPLVITGISLSTLHQSSLGTLFTIMPYRVHPLWYSPILPIMFFISAVALGLSMATFEGQTTSWLYRQKSETSIFAKLNKVTPFVFLLYLVIRFTDLIVRGSISEVTGSGWQVTMFWIEIAFFATPGLLLLVKKIRSNRNWQWVLAFIGVFATVLNRLNTGGLMHVDRGLEAYVPAWTEIIISMGVVSIIAIVFLFVIEHFNILEHNPVDKDALPETKPVFDAVSTTWLGSPEVAARLKYSLVFVIFAALGFSFLSGQDVHSKGTLDTPVKAARGSDVLFVDGNHDGYGVAFTHKDHMARVEGNCAACHHMNLPSDTESECSSCHRDHYTTTDAFGHDWHSSPIGANLTCSKCHEVGDVRDAENVVGCDKCHDDLIPEDATIAVDQYDAMGYSNAMHSMCIKCHKEQEIVLEKDGLGRCAFCHKEMIQYVEDEAIEDVEGAYSGVVVPGL